MRSKIKEYCNKPIVKLTATFIGALGGGFLGVIAYYKDWLG